MSREARLIYLVELLERVYSAMKDDPKDGRVRQYIMIDESQVLINESEECSGIITKFIEEGRKYGRGVMIVTHMSSRLNRQIVANAATFMAFYSREPSEAAYVAKVMSSNFDAEQAVRSKACRARGRGGAGDKRQRQDPEGGVDRRASRQGQRLQACWGCKGSGASGEAHDGGAVSA